MHEHKGYAEVLEPLVVSSDAVDAVTARYGWARAVDEALSAFPSARAGERAASLSRALGDERGLAASLCLASAFFRSIPSPNGRRLQAEMDCACAGSVAKSRTKVWRFFAETLMHVAQEGYHEALAVAEAGLVFTRLREMVNAESSFTRYAIIAELALGRLDDALRRSREEIDAECRWRGRAHEITLGSHAAILTRQSRCAEARLALAEFFEASCRSGWHFLSQFGNAFVELAFRGEQRYSPAASLAWLRARSVAPSTDSAPMRRAPR